MNTPITITNSLPFVQVVVRANDKSLILNRVLLDTGSATTVFKTDDLAKLDIFPEPTDVIRQMLGVGGIETVLEKQVESIEMGDMIATSFTVQMGAMDYGIPMDGILGSDFLLHVGAVINFKTLEVYEV